jgi:hypothetical protein
VLGPRGATCTKALRGPSATPLAVGSNDWLGLAFWARRTACMAWMTVRLRRRLDEAALVSGGPRDGSCLRAALEGIAVGGVYDGRGQSDCPAQHGGAKRHPCLWTLARILGRTVKAKVLALLPEGAALALTFRLFRATAPERTCFGCSARRDRSVASAAIQCACEA